MAVGRVLKEALSWGIETLKEAGIADAKVDAFWLFEAACRISRAQYLLEPDRELTEGELSRYQSFIERRKKHEPCQYITGICEFYGLEFLVNPKVLIPRQDTEILVEEALKRLSDRKALAEETVKKLPDTEGPRVLDLCTGSGAVATAIKHTRPEIEMTATDISEEALEVAKENSRNNHCEITFIQSNLFESVKAKRFDMIVSNPPYVSEAEYETLMPEIKDFEPELALKAGKEGLDIYKELIRKAPDYLKEGGWLLVEIGSSQADAVKTIFAESGFQEICVVKDLAGLDRVVLGRQG